MKRICVLRCGFTRKDGVNRVIADLAYSFRDRLLICVARYDPTVAFEIPESTKIIAFRHPYCDLLPLLSLGAWRLFNIARLLNKEESEVILFTHSMPAVVHASIIKLLLINKKVKVSAYVYDKFEVIPQDGSSLSLKANVLLTRGAVTLLNKFGFVDEFLAISSDILQFVRDQFHTSKVRVVRLGVSNSLLALSKEGNVSGTERLRRIMTENCFKIFYVGILTPPRRLEDLLEALHSLIKDGKTSAHLFVGGALDFAPKYAAAVQKMAHELHLDNNVHFLGVLADEELIFMYRNCDAFVWTGDQSWGLAPLEAMLFGKPAIVSAGSGVSEVLNDSVAIVVPPHSPQSIRSAIEALMQDRSYAEAIGLRAQRFVRENYTFANTADELTRLWQLNS